MKVLGVDPGTGRCGWSVVEKISGNFNLIDSGCVETKANTPLPIRLETIFKTLNQVITEHQPSQASVEDLFFANNQKTIISVGAARGVILLCCQLNNLIVNNYTPLQIKSSITGYGKADKAQVKFMVSKILKIKELPKLDDTVDAIAAALTHLMRSNVRIKT